MRASLGSVALLTGLLLPLVPTSQGQEGRRTSQPVFTGPLRADTVLPVPVQVRRSGGASADKRTAAVFDVTYEGFSPEAQAAFEEAVAIWEERITSSVPIRINAQWTALGENVLGSAGPFLIRDFRDAPLPGTWYPAALANALAGQDLSPDMADIEATFNSDFDRWYLGTDGNPPAGQFDLTTVVLHELGHGLGFIGSFTVENGQGRLQQDNGLDGIPFVFDRYAEDRFGQVLLDTQVYPEPSAALAEVLRDAVFFGGRAVETMMGPAALYTPSPWNPGSSYSHVDEERYPASGVDGLMTPFIGAGEVIREPGPLTCALLQDLGWALAPPCANLVPDTPPLPDVFALEATGSNPFAEVTTLRVQVETPQRVQAWLFDAAGRRLGTLLDAVVEEGGARVLAVNGESLASGVYFVRVVGETFEATRAVTRLR